MKTAGNIYFWTTGFILYCLTMAFLFIIPAVVFFTNTGSYMISLYTFEGLGMWFGFLMAIISQIGLGILLFLALQIAHYSLWRFFELHKFKKL